MQKTMTVRSQKAGGPEPAGVARAAERDEVVAAGDEHRHEGRVLRHLLRVHAEPLRGAGPGERTTARREPQALV